MKGDFNFPVEFPEGMFDSVTFVGPLIHYLHNV